MRSGSKQGKRRGSLRWAPPAVLLLAALVLGVGVLQAPAQSSDGPAVQIRPTSGDAKTVHFDQLGEPDVDGDYSVRDGDEERTQSVQGWSLSHVIRTADVGGYRYIQLNQPGGDAVYLSRRQVRDGFPEGDAVIYEDEGRAAFLRPSYGEDDPNAADSFTSRGTLRSVLRTGSVIAVEASARPSEADPGDEVRFRATLERYGAGQGDRLAYIWRFNDGNRARGESVTHSYERDGTYDASVEVRSPETDDRGASSVTVQVGEPEEGGPPRRGGGSGDGGSDSGVYGGAGDFGGDPYGGGAYDSGAYGNPGDYGDFDDFGGGGRAGGRGGRPYEPAEPFAGETTGVSVDGELIDASATTPLSEDEPGREPAGARSGQLPDESGFGLPGAIVGVLLATGIFSTGVLVEMEKLRPRAVMRRGFGVSELGSRLRGLLAKLGWGR